MSPDLILFLVLFVIIMILMETIGNTVEKKSAEHERGWKCICAECGETFLGPDQWLVAKRYAQHHYAQHELER